MQNVNDCFSFLLKSDQVRGTRAFLDSAQRFLETAVIHTGFLNLFEYKRLFAIFLTGARTHHAEDSIKVIWQSLAASPSRIAVYNEANIYSYVKTNDETGWSVIGGFKLKVPITTGLIYDWAATNLGESYLTSFSKAQCLQIAKVYVLQRTDEKFVEQSLRYFIGGDFDFFVEQIEELKNLAEKQPPAEAAMIDLLREYDKMLLTYRQRIVLEDGDAYNFQMDYGDRSLESFRILKQKHKYRYVISMHNNLFAAVEELAAQWGYQKLGLRVEKLRQKMGKEQIPLPIRLPVE